MTKDPKLRWSVVWDSGSEFSSYKSRSEAYAAARVDGRDSDIYLWFDGAWKLYQHFKGK